MTKVLHYPGLSATSNRACRYRIVVVVALSKKGPTRRWACTSSQYAFVHWRNRVLFSYLIQMGLLDWASAKVKAIAARFPADFCLLASHSPHKNSQHSAALVCEAWHCCFVLQAVTGCGDSTRGPGTQSFLGGALYQHLPPVQCPGRF